jgi:signal peptidase II
MTGGAERARGRLTLGLGLALVILIVDQVTKWWMLRGVFGLEGQIAAGMLAPRLEVTGFLNFTLVWNYGVSFGMFSAESAALRWGLTAFAVVISLALIVWMARTERRWLALGLGLIVGGALGNAIDRVLYGAVADFLDFHAFGTHFWVFNVADAAITLGVVAIVVDSLFSGEQASAKSRDKN